MYSPANSPHLDKKLRKILKKDKKQYERIYKKMGEILKNPHTYKPLGNILYGLRAVHLDPFVLTFSINEKTKIVVFEDFDHHDKIYRN
ncbi:MAG: type II toxin-antitoxin system RelE/ParE family toxin [Candidatus Micrarchaeota archaeon]